MTLSYYLFNHPFLFIIQYILLIEFNPQKRVADEAEEDDEDAESVEVAADESQKFIRTERVCLKPPY